jgi:hypothetical protein
MEFKVEKATASKNGGFVITLRAEGAQDELGFYSKGLKRFAKNVNQLAIGSKVKLDMDKFEEMRISGVYMDPETNEEREYTNVWLMLKGE